MRKEKGLRSEVLAFTLEKLKALTSNKFFKEAGKMKREVLGTAILAFSLSLILGLMPGCEVVEIGEGGDIQVSEYDYGYDYDGVLCTDKGTGGDGAFSSADMTGTWMMHILTVGDDPAYSGWINTKIQVDESGQATCLEHLDSRGHNSCKNINPTNVYVSSDGIVTISGDFPWHGVMNADKNEVTFSDTNIFGLHELGIVTKIDDSVLFDSTDMAGTWMVNILTVDDYSANSGWINAKIQVDDSGQATCLEYLDSIGHNSCQKANPVDVYVSSDGIVTLSEDSSWHGMMNVDKSKVIFTHTNIFGDHEFGILTKMDDRRLFDSTDMAGTWMVNILTVGDDPAYSGWINTKIQIDDSGQATCLEHLDSRGHNSCKNINPTNVYVSSDGIVTLSEDSSWYGVMNADKNEVTFSDTNIFGLHEFGIVTKIH